MGAIGSLVLVYDNGRRTFDGCVSRMLFGYCNPWIENDGQRHATDSDHKNGREYDGPETEAQWLQ